MKSFIILTTTLFNIATVFAATCAYPYGQCGGNNWKGVTCCPSGYTCKTYNQWYSQCVPSGNASSSSSSNNSSSNQSSSNNSSSSNKSSSNNSSSSNKSSSNNSSSNNSSSNNSASQNVQYATSNAVSSSGVIGYASMNGGTNGGNGGKTTTVSNQSQLEAALKGTNAKIIKVNGVIKLSSDVTVNSNTSLIGANKNSGITGAGLKIKNAKNVIIQNLRFSYCLGSNKDCINAQKSTNIWVDHCEFFNDRNHGKDYYDGLIDFTHASDYITISWNYVHDHYKASLIGHSDSNASEDTGKLHVTYHHNYFKNIGSRLPSLRFGTGHIFNNVYENIDTSSVNVRMGAKALVEGNVFRNAKRPISTNLDSKQEGSVVQRNNDFGSTANTNSITRTDGLTSVPYQYSAENVNNVYNSVVRSAGPQ